MRNRKDLDIILRDILGTGNVYFQPPENIKIEYPCIIYGKSDYFTRHADNIKYKMDRRYTIKAIYRHPDSTLPDMIAELPMCSFDRHYEVDNLNHDIFTIYW